MITNMIQAKAAAFLCRTGKDPKSLYLGREEYLALLGFIRECGLRYCDERKTMVPSLTTYDGMAVYVVLEESHLEVA